MVVLKRKEERVPKARFLKTIDKDGSSWTIEWCELVDGPWPHGKINLKVYDKR